MPDKAILLYGGGLDSTALLTWLMNWETRPNPHEELSAIHFQYGQKAEVGELKAVTYFCKKYSVPLKVVRVPIDEIAGSAILKGRKKNTQNLSSQNRLEARNVIFVSMAATWAATIDAERIYLGYHHEPEGEPFPDATIGAVDAMNVVLRATMEHRVRIVVPFADLTRQQVLNVAYRFDREIVDHSFTCYESLTTKECGKCAHCLLKKEMLKVLGHGVYQAARTELLRGED